MGRGDPIINTSERISRGFHRLALVLAAVLILGCEKSQQISEEQAALLDAVAFLTNDFEEGRTSALGLPPMQRTVAGNTIEYVSIDHNPAIGDSESTFPESTFPRDSKFIKWIARVSSPQNCVFRIDSRSASSKGEASDAFSDPSASVGTVYDLNKASRFEVELRDVAGLSFRASSLRGGTFSATMISVRIKRCFPFLATT